MRFSKAPAERIIKPPYRVPSMDEIRAIPWNGLTVASTFAGGGGSSTGYRLAGFRVLYANEFVPAARETYAANCAPYTFVDGRDIREVTAESILEACGLKRGELDVFDGSPPCASFSTAGKREKGWGTTKKYSDTEQRSDDLFYEYARLVDGLQPRAFVAENVSGLVKGTAKGYFLRILERLKACGYRVEARLLDAQWLGVPQARQRLIFVGVRDDLGLDPVYPAALPYRYSVRDALPWVTRVGAIRQTGFRAGRMQEADEPCPTIMAGGGGGMNTSQFGLVAAPEPHLILGGGNAKPNKPGNSFPRNKRISVDEPCPTVMAAAEIIGSAPHEFYGPPVEPESDITRYAIGAEWDKIKPGERSEKYFQLEKPDIDKPMPTVLASSANFPSAACAVHHYEKRKFSIGELRRICSFPDDFAVAGTYGQQWERLGRAVPPVMMSHIAGAVRDLLLQKDKAHD